MAWHGRIDKPLTKAMLIVFYDHFQFFNYFLSYHMFIHKYIHIAAKVLGPLP